LLNVPNAPLSSQYRTFFPGQTIDDTIIPTAPMIAAGCVLWPASDPIVSAAGAKIFASRRACGADPTAAAARLTAAIAGATNGAALGWPGAAEFQSITKYTATIGFAQLTAAAGTQTISPSTLALPASSRIIAHELTVGAGFTGGGLTGMSVSIGGNGSSNDLVSAASVFAAASLSGTAGSNPQPLYATATQIGVLFTSTGGNVNACTAGSVTLDLLIALLP
jgi:hypothetical protein